VGVLDRFEKGVERAVNGVFARAFRSEVQPVELASALKREADDHASIVGRNRTIAPNSYVVELGPADHRRLAQWEDALGDELSTVLNDHALQQRYAFVGPVSVRFERSEELDTGVFRVRSRTARAHGDHGDAPADRPGTAQPAPDGAWYQQPGRAPAEPEPYPARAGHGDPGYGDGGHGGYQGSAPPWPGQPPAEPDLAPPTLELDGRSFPLTRGVTVLGRSGDVDVPLDDAGVSRRHAEVHVSDGRARVVDLGSTNGTFVDGERVTTGELRDGSTITVGRSRLVFRVGQSAAGRRSVGPW
jgi:predicted component of type VI protein secretion system